MVAKGCARSISGIPQWVIVPLTVAGVLLPCVLAAQGLTGALIGTIKDEQGAVIPGALVRVASPSLIGGPATICGVEGVAAGRSYDAA